MEENQKQQEQRQGSGVFLIIVGVATLIVAIIGASFAYFSSQASSAQNAINLQAHEFNATLNMQEVFQTNADLIPVDPDAIVTGATAPNNTNILYALNVRKACVDDQGYRICALYEITLENDGDTALELSGSLITNKNDADPNRVGATPFTNLKYRLVTKTVENSNDVYAPEVTVRSVPALNESATLGSNIQLGAAGSGSNTQTIYVLIYLDENDNQSAEMGATYGGQIVFTSTSSGDQITGTFTLN